MKDVNDPAGWPSNYPGFTGPRRPADPPAPLPAPPDDADADAPHTDLFMAMALVLLILIVGVPLLVASILFGA